MYYRNVLLPMLCITLFYSSKMHPMNESHTLEQSFSSTNEGTYTFAPSEAFKTYLCPTGLLPASIQHFFNNLSQDQLQLLKVVDLFTIRNVLGSAIRTPKQRHIFRSFPAELKEKLKIHVAEPTVPCQYCGIKKYCCIECQEEDWDEHQVECKGEDARFFGEMNGWMQILMKQLDQQNEKLERSESYGTSIKTSATSSSCSQNNDSQKEFRASRHRGEGYTEFHKACEVGSFEEVKALFAQGVDIFARNYLGYTALHYASRNKDTRILEFLLRKKGKIDDLSNEGKTPLHCACEESLLEVMKVLVEKGAHVHAITTTKLTALHFVAGGQHDAPDVEKAINFLVNKKCNVNSLDKDKRTPLHVACKRGSIRAVRALLERGAHINAVTSEGNTPLLMAIDRGGEIGAEIAIELLKRGADVHIANKSGIFALGRATRLGDTRLVRKLIHEGKAQVDFQNNKGMSALLLGINRLGAIKLSMRSPEIINNADGAKTSLKILLDEGKASLDLRDKDKGWTAFHHAVALDLLDCLQILCDYAHDRPVQFNDGQESPLHLAVSLGRREHVALLIQTFSSMNDLKDERGRTALHEAVELSWYDIVKDLIRSGVRQDVQDDRGMTARDYAQSDPEMVSLFNTGCSQSSVDDDCDALENQLEIQSTHATLGSDKKMRTSLHYAAAKGWAAEVKRLLAHGAQATAKDINGQTALHAAAYERECYPGEENIHTFYPVLPDEASKHDYSEVARLLHAAGIDLEGLDNNGETPLAIAMRTGNQEIMPTLAKLINRCATCCRKNSSSGILCSECPDVVCFCSPLCQDKHKKIHEYDYQI